MSELFDQIDALRQVEGRAALATLVNTHGTTPRKEGAKMLVGEGGRILGSVTIGGCVDAQVIEEAEDVLDRIAPEAPRAGPRRRGRLGDRAHLRRHHRGVPRAGRRSAGARSGGHPRALREAPRATSQPAAPARSSRGWTRPTPAPSSSCSTTGGARARWAIRSSTRRRRRGARPSRDGRVAHRRARPGVAVKVFVEVISPPPTLLVVGGEPRGHAARDAGPVARLSAPSWWTAARASRPASGSPTWTSSGSASPPSWCSGSR